MMPEKTYVFPCVFITILLITFSGHSVQGVPPITRPTVREEGEWCACSEVTGVCINTDVYECSGNTLTGQCPGPSNVRCCPFPSGVQGGSCYSENVGLCTRTENCPRMVITGRCPGPSAITCCPPEKPSPSSTSPCAQNPSEFLPPKPDSSENMGACTTPYDALEGYCIDRAECTGGTFNDLCPGSSSILCCVRETRCTSAVPESPLMTLDEFEQLFTNVSPTRASALYPYFLASLSTADINTCLRIAAYSAQIAHESVGLLYFEEIADGSAYEGRESLGNTMPGDGPRYKGRGPIQLTGRANYRSAGTDLGRSFEENPEQVGMPSGGFQAAAWYWQERVSNADADENTTAGFDRITVAINGCGGDINRCNGVEDRRERWAQAKSVLGC